MMGTPSQSARLLARYQAGRGRWTGWAEGAYRAIRAVIEAMPDGEAPADTLARVDAAYPFGERAMFPYKMWLRDRAVLMVALGLREGKPLTKRRMEIAEQMELLR